MEFYLTWFEKIGDRYLGERVLVGLETDEVRARFQLRAEEYRGDCLVVTAGHVQWLSGIARELNIQINDFDYFVEARRNSR